MSIRRVLRKRFWAAAIKGRRDRVLISTKATFAMGEGPNEVGSSRFWLTRAVEASLKRLGTDRIDLFQLHGFDALTPQEEVMRVLDDLVSAGKILYTGASNFSGWHLMKSLAVSDRYGLVRHVAHQAYYSLIGREYEWELMPLALDQGVGAVVWSPLGWGRLGGKYRRSNPIGPEARASRNAGSAPAVADDLFYDVMDALDAVAARDRQKRGPDRAELGAVAAERFDGHHRRSERGAAARQSGGGGLVADGRSGGAAGCGECAAAGLSVLASGRVPAEEPVAGGGVRPMRDRLRH